MFGLRSLEAALHDDFSGLSCHLGGLVVVSCPLLADSDGCRGGTQEGKSNDDCNITGFFAAVEVGHLVDEVSKEKIWQGVSIFGISRCLMNE
jgi:hypothetical protein